MKGKVGRKKRTRVEFIAYLVSIPSFTPKLSVASGYPWFVSVLITARLQKLKRIVGLENATLSR